MGQPASLSDEQAHCAKTDTATPTPIPLCNAIETIIATPSSQPMEFNIFHEQLVSMGRILKKVSEITGHRTIFLNIPSRILLAPLDLLQRNGINTPITADNLRGYIANDESTHRSDIRKLLNTIPSPDDMITEAVLQIIRQNKTHNSETKVHRQ